LTVLAVKDGRVQPEPWRNLLQPFLEAASQLSFAAEAELKFDCTATWQRRVLKTAKADAELPGVEWSTATDSAALGAGRAVLAVENNNGLKINWRGGVASWKHGDIQTRFNDAEIAYGDDCTRISFALGSVAGEGWSVAGGGEVSLKMGTNWTPVSAVSVLRLDNASMSGEQFAANGVLKGSWSEEAVGLTSELIDLKSAYALRLRGLEAVIGVSGQSAGRVTASAEIGLLPGQSDFAKSLTCYPEEWTAKANLNAVLENDQQSCRIVLKIPTQRRALQGDRLRISSVVGGDALVNLDRSHISGRLSLGIQELAAVADGSTVSIPQASLIAQWPRVWHRAVAGWGSLSPERLWRELAWAGDYTLDWSNATLGISDGWAVEGLTGRMSSKGSELHETDGVSIGMTAARVAAGDRRATDFRLDAAFGLLGGSVRGEAVLVGLPVRPSFDQVLSWTDGFSAQGSVGFDMAVFSGSERLADWWEDALGYSVAGGIGLNGRSRYSDGVWSLGADVIFNDCSVWKSGENWRAQGLRGRLVCTDLISGRTQPNQTLAFETFTLGDFEVGPGTVKFGYAAPDRLEVAAIQTEAFGGRCELGAFACDPRNPVVETDLKLKGCKLDELLRLFDNVPAEAEGAIEGELPISWKGGKFAVGTGSLKLGSGEVARVHFTQELNLLTRGRDPSSQNYKALREVEQSIRRLVVDRLQINSCPKDSPGQSLQIRVVGAPEGGEFPVPVSLDINLNAPLDHFLKVGELLTGTSSDRLQSPPSP
jgi:hypothetical protein